MSDSIASVCVNTSIAGASPPDPTSQPVANQSATSGQTGRTQPVANEPATIPEAPAWHLLAQRFLGQELSTQDRAVLTADAVYSPLLSAIDARLGDLSAIADWFGKTQQPPQLLQHFKDRIDFEQTRLDQLTRWEEEADRPEGNSPRRIAGSIVHAQAEAHGWPTVMYSRKEYWAYGPKEPLWEPQPSWVEKELPPLVNYYVDAWNQEEIQRVALVNNNLMLEWQQACKTNPNTPKPQLEKPVGLVSDKQASQLTTEVLKQIKPHIVHEAPPIGPFWIHPAPLDPPATRIIPLQNGLLDISVPAQPRLLRHTSRFFSPNLLPFTYDPQWPRPDRFLRILEDQFGAAGDLDEDTESKEAILEFFALCLIPELKYQKFLILLGESGTGRSTLIDCFLQVLGERNHSPLDVQTLNNPHGKAGLVDKLLIVFNDSRSGDTQDNTQMLQFLLQLVGGDKQHINPKFKDTFAARLLARAIMVCNVLPNFRYSTTAMERRTLICEFKRKVVHKNENLAQEIREHELPGILNELLKALVRLEQRGHFVQPQRAWERIEELRDASSNLFDFVEECCEHCQGQSVPLADAYDVYYFHARQVGTKPLNKTNFRIHLPAAANRVFEDGEVRVYRPWTQGKAKREHWTVQNLVLQTGLLNKARLKNLADVLSS
jgi:putative DNA primase/helicase